MGFAADISGTLPGLVPAQQSVVSGLAAGAATRTVRKSSTTRPEQLTASMTPAGDLLSIELIREAVQECLQESIQETAGDLAALMADDEIVQLLHKLMGRPGDRETVARSLQDVVNAFSALAAKDGQPIDVVRAIGHFIEKLKVTTAQLTELRQQAARGLQEELKKANDLLGKIAATNRRILEGAAIGQFLPQSATTQQVHLSELAKTIDFSSFRREDGSVAIFTKEGVTLAREQAALLVSDQHGIKADGIDIALQLAGGAVHAFLHNRDIALPNVQTQLDSLAQVLQSRINQISNRALSGSDARSFYRASRTFSDPAGFRLSLAGGDSEIALLRPDGSSLTRTSLSFLVKHYRRSCGLPVAGPWPIGQVVAGLNRWIGSHLPAAAPEPVVLTEAGTVLVELPPQTGLRLAISDRRSLTIHSAIFPHTDRPLGLKGQLTLTDGIGNEFSTLPIRGGVALTPEDNLAAVAAKLDHLDGLSARLLVTNQGSRLVIHSLAGSDITTEPDRADDTVASQLALVPAEDQLSEDVAVNGIPTFAAPAFISRCFASAQGALGLQGALILRSPDGAMLGFQTLQADWTLDRLVERLQNASDPRLTAQLVASGNQFTVKIGTSQPEDRFFIEGWPEGWQTTPRFNFAASGGELAIAAAGRPLGGVTISAGSGFAQIAAQIAEPAGLLARAGLRAQLLRAGTAEILDIGHRLGLPLAFHGSAVGAGSGQLDLRYNVRDQLGLAGPATQTVPGLANFFGLNDLFVAQPGDGFDGKAAVGVFATTAAAGTASALALAPGLLEDPAQLGATSTIRQISDLLNNSLNFAEAGDLPRGSYRPAQYADAIIGKVQSAAANNRVQLSYHRALLDQLGREMVGQIDVNGRLQALMTLQQTYHDATQLVAGLARLRERLN
jgi:flagellar hook-associated protein FlgK